MHLGIKWDHTEVKPSCCAYHWKNLEPPLGSAWCRNWSFGNFNFVFGLTYVGIHVVGTRSWEFSLESTERSWKISSKDWKFHQNWKAWSFSLPHWLFDFDWFFQLWLYFPTSARAFQLHSFQFHFELTNFSFFQTALFNYTYPPRIAEPDSCRDFDMREYSKI